MRKQLWNDGWKMHRGTSSAMDSVMSGSSAQAEKVRLPHDAMLSMDRSADAPSGPGMAYFHGEDIEYRKEFTVPEEERGLAHVLYFDGVYMDAEVFVNGNFVTRHGYGYAPFSARIDEYLRIGGIHGGRNTVRVVVRGQGVPNSRWYPGEGIYRDVWMYTGNPVHIAVDGVQVTTVDADRELATLSIETTIVNDGAAAKEGYAALLLRGPNGDFAAERRAGFTIRVGETIHVRQQVDLDEPQLWDADHPALYTCTCRLVEREETVSSEREAGISGSDRGAVRTTAAGRAAAGSDSRSADPEEAEVSFGIRKLQLDSRNGLRINGQSVKLRGGCVHHDNGVLGAVSVEDAEMRRVSLLKMGGYNAIRTAHNPPSTALLNACDRLGMLVMHEFTDVWTQAKTAYDYAAFFPRDWEQDVENTVRRDYNHPSIILWSIGNEIPETGDPIGAQWGRKLAEKYRSLDSSRFITNGINVLASFLPHMQERMQEVQKDTEDAQSSETSGLNDLLGAEDFMKTISKNPVTEAITEESCDLLDVVGYNYTEERYEREHEQYPYRIFVGSETFPANLDRNWALVEKYPFVLGDFSWTAWDYIGEAGCGRIDASGDRSFVGAYPWLLASDGDFDLTGWPRPISYWRQTVWGLRHGQPYIAVQRIPNYGKDKYVSAWAFTDSVESWTWPGYEGQNTAVEVYTDAAEAELSLNGRSLGRKKVGEEGRRCYVRWEVTYEPGELSVCVYGRKGYQEGKATLETAGQPNLCITNDRVHLRAGSEDLCYLDIELRDEDGILYTDSERSARIEIQGPATIAGSGSADPCTEESYIVPEHRFYEGRMQAVIRAGQERGNILVTVTSEGMEPETVELKSV